MTSTHLYSDLSRRRLVDLCVQRGELLRASVDALDDDDVNRRDRTRMAIRKHLHEVETAAQIRRGTRVEEGTR